MATLREVLAEQLPRLREEMRAFAKEKGDAKVSDVSVAQVLGGMRGVVSVICDTSTVDPITGLHIREQPIADLADKLPEEVFYLILTGRLPDEDGVVEVREQLRLRSVVPREIWAVLEAMPSTSHPMTMLSTGILALENFSHFRRRYDEGMPKDEYWEAAYEDALDLIAKLPALAAYIYRLCFDKGPRIQGDPSLDLGANFAYMLGAEKDGDFAKLMRLYLTLHIDHGGGNVSAFTTHTVGSALSNPYLALSAGLNGLAGPLHGLANQECLKWILDLMHHYGGVPSQSQVKEHAEQTLAAGRVIPGYGHAVLRATDPRFTAFKTFADAHCPSNPWYQAVNTCFEVIPGVLEGTGKVSNPWPNVDAISGSLLYYYGLTEFSYYTVLFAVSRAMGVLGNYVINRGIGSPIVRPKGTTFKKLKAMTAQQG